MKTTILLVLRGENCYQTLRESLNLPHPNAVKSYFGTLRYSW